MDTISKEKRSAMMGRVKGKNTKPELVVRQMLHRNGYRFRLHRKDLAGNPDIVLPKYKTVIFVNGCFWHGHTCRRGKRPDTNTAYWDEKLSKNIERDLRNYTALEAKGWQVVVIWECDVRDLTIDTLTNVIGTSTTQSSR